MKGSACALAALLFVAAPAFAQDAPANPPAPQGEHRGGGGRGFDAMDTDHDGKVSREEWTAAGRNPKRFDMIDADHDGQITREELRAFIEKMRAERGANGGDWPGGHDRGAPEGMPQGANPDGQ